MLSSKKLRIRSGHRCARLPLGCANCGDDGGSDQAVHGGEVQEKQDSSHRFLGSVMVSIATNRLFISTILLKQLLQLMVVNTATYCRISFGLAAIFLGTASSMNGRQPYGRGWLRGECYVVKDGIYAGAAVLAAATVVLIVGFISSTTADRLHRRTGPDMERNQRAEQQQKQAGAGHQ